MRTCGQAGQEMRAAQQGEPRGSPLRCLLGANLREPWWHCNGPCLHLQQEAICSNMHILVTYVQESLFDCTLLRVMCH
jgi:hypothetical protein